MKSCTYLSERLPRRAIRGLSRRHGRQAESVWTSELLVDEAGFARSNFWKGNESQIEGETSFEDHSRVPSTDGHINTAGDGVGIFVQALTQRCVEVVVGYAMQFEVVALDTEYQVAVLLVGKLSLSYHACAHVAVEELSPGEERLR